MRLIIIITLLFSWYANAASFDCSQATLPAENLICQTDRLSRLDDMLAKRYEQLKEVAIDQEPVKQDQREWLLNTRNACDTVPCLVNVYNKRVGDLVIETANQRQLAHNTKSTLRPPLPEVSPTQAPAPETSDQPNQVNHQIDKPKATKEDNTDQYQELAETSVANAETSDLPATPETQPAEVLNDPQEQSPEVAVAEESSQWLQDLKEGFSDFLFMVILVAMLVVMVGGLMNQVVVFYDMSDVWETLLTFILLISAGLIADQDFKGIYNVLANIVAVVLFLLALRNVVNSFRRAIYYNQNVLLGVVVGVYKLLFVLVATMMFFDQESKRSDKNATKGDIAGAVFVMAIIAAIAKFMVNGKKVYAKKGWTELPVFTKW